MNRSPRRSRKEEQQEAPADRKKNVRRLRRDAFIHFVFISKNIHFSINIFTLLLTLLLSFGSAFLSWST